MVEELDIGLDSMPAAPPVSWRGMNLRPYQAQGCDAVEDGWQSARSQLLVLPTGCGKTICFSDLSEREISRGGRVLILAHRDELVNQAIDKLERSTGLKADKEKAGDWASRDAFVVVGSVQTMRGNRLASWPADHFSLVIVDEAHRALATTYQDIFKHFAGARVLGVTATPDRGDRKNLGTFFERVAYSYSLIDAVLDGWLVRPVAEMIPLDIDLRGIRTKTTDHGTDYNERDLEDRIAPVMAAIAGEIKTHAGMMRTVIFTPGVETARLCAEALRDVGIAADWVCGECKDRKEKIARFISGETTHLANAQVLCEGFDLDAISCVVPLRPTKSRGFFVQQVGRGTRPMSGIVDKLATNKERVAAIAASSKPSLLILDFFWQTDKHDIVRPVHLIAANTMQAEEMQKRIQKPGTLFDLLEAQADAKEAVLERLEEEVRKHKNKKRRTIDPLAFAVSVGDGDLAEYEPETINEMQPATRGQLDYLAEQGIDTCVIKFRGHASKLIEKLHRRAELGLCSLKQMCFLERAGYKDAALLRADEAQRLVGRTMKSWKSHRG